MQVFHDRITFIVIDKEIISFFVQFAFDQIVINEISQCHQDDENSNTFKTADDIRLIKTGKLKDQRKYHTVDVISIKDKYPWF